MKARRHFGYTPPAIDSAVAIANAQMLLTGARSLDHFQAESFARQHRLSLKRAEYMLTVELQRRAAGNA